MADQTMTAQDVAWLDATAPVALSFRILATYAALAEKTAEVERLTTERTATDLNAMRWSGLYEKTRTALAEAQADSERINWMQNNPNFALTIRDDGTATIFTNFGDYDGANFREALDASRQPDPAPRGTPE